MRPGTLPLLLTAALAAACHGDPAGPIAGEHLQVVYSGDRDGDFATLGRLDPQVEGDAGVVASPLPADFGGWSIRAVRAIAEGRSDRVRVELAEVETPGTYPLSLSGCLPGTEGPCRTVAIAFDVSGDPGVGQVPADRLYLVSDGSVTIESIAADRIVGRFEGEAVRADDDRIRLRLSSGRFDAPVTTVEDPSQEDA